MENTDRSSGIKKISRFLARLLERLESNIYLRAIQRGLLFSLPLIIVGAVSLCILNLPSPTMGSFLDGIFGEGWRTFFSTIVQATMGISSLTVVCAIALNITVFFNAQKKSGSKPHINPIMAAMVALSCYFMLIGTPESWVGTFSMSQGLITAIVTSVAINFVFLHLASCRFLHLSFNSVGHDQATFQVLSLVPASILTIIFFAGVRISILNLFPNGLDVSEVLIKTLFGDGSGELGFGLIYTGLSQLFWFFGIHGPNILFSLEQGTLHVAAMENIQAFMAHTAPQHIVTKGFLDSFVYMGGSGGTLGLILAVFLKSRDPGNRRLCYIALLPALCNVNEPLLFGIPLVFNPLYFIPFLLGPVINLFTAYAATAFDLVPKTIASVHWTTPPLISGYIATGSIAGTMLQVVNLAVSTAIYVPFIMLAEALHKRQVRTALKKLCKYAEKSDLGPDGKICLGRPGFTGYLARSLADEMVNALRHGDQLRISYQPQVDAETNMVEGVECLLRWKHPRYGTIPPPVAVAVAEDCGIMDNLGSFVLRTACSSFKHWKPLVKDDFLMSINLSASQLNNAGIADSIMDILDSTGTPPHHLEVEITESVAITHNRATFQTLSRLKAKGVKIAIDDFGMGHTSLRYIKDFPINTIKLDKTFTEKTNGMVNDHIVNSLMSLSKSLHLRTIVEGVETLEQYDRFKNMGCTSFQGYFFSKPLTNEEFTEFLEGRR